MVITHKTPGARNMIIVDPKTGLQIEHVKAMDPEKGWLEIWRTQAAHPDYKSIWVQDGKTVEKDFMLIQTTDGEGVSTYASYQKLCNFDVVNKFTGEVLYEGRVPPPSDEASPEPLPEPSSARTF